MKNHRQKSVSIKILALLAIASVVIIYSIKAKNWSISQSKDIHPNSDTLYIGSTEEYIDHDMLLFRFQRYYKAKINTEKYKSRTLKELYRLLKDNKINCLVISIANVDTSSIVWSEPYAIDNIGRNGLRLGLPKTKHNQFLIKQFNHL
ncbi:hypothetical protein VB776_15745 [Arcicella sp. DC2W]|uniref:Uncharacterized protein n=1 Tax=Arcicella gelida TaxID=2984195 RepID=A0ABU5S7C4_9BACT|nr:hypothetical protein [Arcicella sp. DC2W]MEA5404386.1 hypothetical protein [Arcicella sp. DC2W]